MTMTHTANAEPRLPHDYTTPPAAPVREYRMTPEEAARYPAVRPTRQDFDDATEQGWTPDRFAAEYGRDAKHTDILRRAFRSVLDARDMRRRRGEDEDERPPVERGPAVTTSEWIVRIKAVLREHPDWSRRQVAEALGTTTGVINNAMVRTGSNLTELRARVQRELAEAADNAAQTTDKNTEVEDVANRAGLNLTTEAIKQVLTEHRNWTGAQIAAEFGLTHKQFENWCTRNNISLREIRKRILLGAFAAQRQPTTPASEPPPTAPAEPPETEEPAPGPMDRIVCCDYCDTDESFEGELQHKPDCPLRTCPICHRAVAACNHEGDCERSGRHGGKGVAAEAHKGPRCRICQAPRSGESVDEKEFWAKADLCSRCAAKTDRVVAAVQEFQDAQAREVVFSHDALPGTIEHPGICATCIKSDVCRHITTLTDWFERAQLPDVDLDIELDIIVRRCEAYRGEGAA